LWGFFVEIKWPHFRRVDTILLHFVFGIHHRIGIREASTELPPDSHLASHEKASAMQCSDFGAITFLRWS
jgi:hypothetical protein